MASEHQMVQAKAKLPISVYNKLKSLKSNLHYRISKSGKVTYLVSMTLDKYIDAGALIASAHSRSIQQGQQP